LLGAHPRDVRAPQCDAVQYETYRRMRRALKNSWGAFCPATNCQWMHYLADALLTSKGLPLTRPQKKDLTAFR
jgi:hypothetical protein